MPNPNFIDRIGQVFTRLTVIGRAKNDKRGNARWKCKCTCGNIVTVVGYSLVSNMTKSCGCLQKEITRKNRHIHGMRFFPEYKTWIDIKQRCHNVHNPSFYKYGGRGIKVCNEWINSFPVFYKYIGNKPSEKHSIERINNNGNYEPGNVRWATYQEQANNRRNNHFITIDEQTFTIAQWARLVNIHPGTIYSRIHEGWSSQKAIFKPVRKHLICQK